MAFKRIDQTYTPESPSSGLMKAAMANPFEGLMKTVEDFATQQGKQNAQQAALTDVMAGKQPGPSIGLTPFGQAYNDAAQKAYEAQTSNDLRAKSIEIASQFSGMKAGDADNADQMMKAHIEGLSKNIPEQFRASVLFEAEARRADLYSKIAGAEKEHQFKLNIENIKTALDNDLVEAQMRARDGDMVAANAVAAKALERSNSLVEAGFYTPEMAASSMKDFKDAQDAEEVIGSAIRSGNMVNIAQAVQNGDGQFKNTPLKVRDYIVKELAQEVSRRDTLAKKQVASFDKQARYVAEGLDAGKAQSGQDLAFIDAVEKGQIQLSQDAFDKLQESNWTSKIGRPMLDLPANEAAKQYVRMTSAANIPESVTAANVQTNVKKMVDAHIAGLRGNDPTGYLDSIGAIGDVSGVKTLDTSSPQAFASSFSARKDAIDSARVQYQSQAIPYVSADDSKAIRSMFSGMNEEEKLAAFQFMQQAIPDETDRKDTLKYIWKDQASSYSVAGARPDLAKEIIRGQAMIDSGAGKIESNKIEGVVASARLASTGHDPQYTQFSSMRDAATALYMSRYPGLVGGAFDDGKYKDCFDQIAGKTAPVGVNNGLEFLPVGMSQNEFEDRWRNVTEEEILSMGGTKEIAYILRTGNLGLGLQPYQPEATRGLIKSRAGTTLDTLPRLSGETLFFRKVDDNQYALFDGAMPINDASGKPFVLDMSKVSKKASAFETVAAGTADVAGIVAQGLKEIYLPGTLGRVLNP